MIGKRTLFVLILSTCVCLIKASGSANEFSAVLSLKSPGNDSRQYAVNYSMGNNGDMSFNNSGIPVTITRKVTRLAEGKEKVNVTIKALKDVFFSYGEQLKTGFKHDMCQFYMPGFWYRKNLRSPTNAPSFHTSDSWIVREDRLSSPLSAAYIESEKKMISVIRADKHSKDALTTHKEGEVIISGETSIGYVGFENVKGNAVLSYGFPFKETPKSYIRKLTLSPQITSFQQLKAGQSITLNWEILESNVSDFSDCVKSLWEYSYDIDVPKPLNDIYSIEMMKDTLSNYFVESYVGTHPLKYYSGADMLTYTCDNTDHAQVGFIGRVLLNAFNSLEYAELKGRDDIIKNAISIFDSYLNNGITDSGFFFEDVKFNDKDKKETIYSIRRQSEGVYAILYYLQYEKEHKRKHLEWEKIIRRMLDNYLRLQNQDGSFPRKFKDDYSSFDATGGSTPSATLPLIMGYKYFKDKRYLESAKRTVDYLEKEIISKADYFSSTLDANCEDKEAAIAAATATYYLALVTKGQESMHYAELAKKSAYFGLSWYYTWDVPFAQGEMLGDIGLKTRGWGNVSVENNHIDVFVFEFADVLNWLSERYKEPRFSEFAQTISTSMRQLLPFNNHMCGIAKVGFYPEVVQHTYWDYGRNGKGFYNNYFAPGWTVASLWQLLTPGRAEKFLCK